jgi:hypothetical protein
MKRLVIFSVLGPLALTIMMVILSYVAEGRVIWQHINLPLMYAFTVIPFLVLCFFDWMLAARNTPYRPAVVAAISFVLALLLIRRALADSFGNWWAVAVFVLSAIPAVVCSWLSGEK